MIYQVAGPPCAGKSTWIRAHAIDGRDLVLDDNQLAARYGRGRIPGHIWRAWYDRLDHLVATWKQLDRDLYVIRSNPAPLRKGNLRVVLLDPGLDECLRRAAADRRPPVTRFWIRDWYAAHRPEALSTGRRRV